MKNTQSKTSFEAVFAHDVEKKWPIIWPQLHKALDKSISKDSIHAIKTALLTSKAEAVIVNGGSFVMIVEIIMHSAGPVFRVPYAGGDLLPILPDVLEWIDTRARNLGCKFVEIPGRKGFEKALAPYDYDFAYQVMMKELK